jgi:hypothetical protein
LVRKQSMARSDWWYPNIPRKQADALDVIVKREGLKYGIIDKGELVRFIIADFMRRYEEEYGLIGAIKSVKFRKAENELGHDVRP